MSSAATQAAPQLSQVAGHMGSHSAATSPSARHYQHSPPHDPLPPSVTTRPSRRRPSAIDTSMAIHTQPPSSYSPAASPQHPKPSSRAQAYSAQPSPTLASPTSPPSNIPRASDPSAGPPFALPPRTSSQQQRSTTNAMPLSPSANEVPTSSSSRQPTRAADERPSPAKVTANSNTGEVEQHARAKDDATAAAVAATRARRKAQAQSANEVPRRSASTREAREAQSTLEKAHGHSSTAMGAANTTGVPKEGSAVINRVVVTDPQVDVTRERERMAEARPAPVGTDVTPVTGLGLVSSEGVEDGGRGAGKARQEHPAGYTRRKETKFGDYILGQTLGEGEFGKVKIGWKKENGIEVAIKLIRRESLGSNPSRLPKIYREISILRGLSHPNIVRLHEMVETERHIGIILEYASGGELFDYILHHRYLKDNAARRLFAQLVSGVGYLHKKGIVHRDLKLENLLLDRNRNIIITDFGFANTFDPHDELGDEIEYNLSNREFVRRMDLDAVRENGFRRGDLMQTSCGSPCYAAPELVVSDSLYTGRKVDVWSCGVILYAMLAGYLPFDDDPANPEGDNINLLYKYIVSTPLTFPEYVTPHARDLLRRILVPDPRKRADLFEVARHSWLSEYSHVVSFITSATTTSGDIANTTVSSDDQQAGPLLARSASVREPTKTHQPFSPGGLGQKHGHIDQDEVEKPKTHRDAKRRTVQVEYVAPQSQTARGEASPPVASSSNVAPSNAAPPPSSSRTRARAGSQGAVDALRQPATASAGRPHTSSRIPVPEPLEGLEARKQQVQSASENGGQRRASASQAAGRPQSRPGGKPRAVTDTPSGQTASAAPNSVPTARPRTGGSMASMGARPESMRLPSRGNSYSQPAAPAVAATNAHGKLAQPKYAISHSIPQHEPLPQDESIGRPSTQHLPTKYPQEMDSAEAGGRGHKRSNTVSGFGEKLFGRSGSVFGARNQGPSSREPGPQKLQKSYPPTSMAGPIASDSPRPSIDSRRSISFGFGRKNSDLAGPDRSRRFSLLPSSFSFRGFGGNGGNSPRDQPPSTSYSMSGHPPSRGYSRHQQGVPFDKRASPPASASSSSIPQMATDGQNAGSNRNSPVPSQGRPFDNAALPPGLRQPHQPYAATNYASYQEKLGSKNIEYAAQSAGLKSNQTLPTESDASLATGATNSRHKRSATQPQNPRPGFTGGPSEDYYHPQPYPSPPPNQHQQYYGRPTRGPSVLQKGHRKFTDAYEQEHDAGRVHSQHGASSGAAKKVMDFFRRRGKARVGDER